MVGSNGESDRKTLEGHLKHLLSISGAVSLQAAFNHEFEWLKERAGKARNDPGTRGIGGPVRGRACGLAGLAGGGRAVSFISQRSNGELDSGDADRSREVRCADAKTGAVARAQSDLDSGH